MTAVRTVDDKLAVVALPIIPVPSRTRLRGSQV